MFLVDFTALKTATKRAFQDERAKITSTLVSSYLILAAQRRLLLRRLGCALLVRHLFFREVTHNGLSDHLTNSPRDARQSRG